MDKSYLNDLSEKVYGFAFDRVVHNRERKETFESLKAELDKLSEEDKVYVNERVQELFDDLKKRQKRSKRTA